MKLICWLAFACALSGCTNDLGESAGARRAPAEPAPSHERTESSRGPAKAVTSVHATRRHAAINNNSVNADTAGKPAPPLASSERQTAMSRNGGLADLRHAQRGSFGELARAFAVCWDADQVATLSKLTGRDGLWVVYNVGVRPRPYYFRHSPAVFHDEYRDGFGNVRQTYFGCIPSKGGSPPLPNCKGENAVSSCRFGRVALTDSLAMRTHPRVYYPPEKESLSAQVLKRVTNFVTDDTDATFYFAKLDGAWTLLLVSTADCLP